MEKNSQQSSHGKGVRRVGWGSLGINEQYDQSVESKGQVREVRLEREVGPGVWTSSLILKANGAQ